jgi:hypothetical protein
MDVGREVRLVVHVTCSKFDSWSGQSILCEIAEPAAIKNDIPK